MSELGFDLQFVVSHYNYWMFVILMMTGLYITVSRVPGWRAGAAAWPPISRGGSAGRKARSRPR